MNGPSINQTLQLPWHHIGPARLPSINDFVHEFCGLLNFRMARSLYRYPLPDIFSRKRSIIFGALLFAVGAALETVGITIVVLFVARAVAGFPV
ncbi:hypothetical protein BC936DRAFT_141443 [Jimgerdemannia flammicorona]|uniref:Major facilitator superfamily (MFS) profile domain-containing protein n=1 Tax=Jimgerdemannia flammicorona TaxID=994334 RepID=A0A433A291_9FUNG|nr:hypothetical protein BC936DRAFT_141443 [Jimgerdemannia flammicorona]